MASLFDFLGYSPASGQGDPDLGGLLSFLTPTGMPAAQSSLNAAALGGLPLSSPPQGYDAGVAIAQQLLRLAPSASRVGRRPPNQRVRSGPPADVASRACLCTERVR